MAWAAGELSGGAAFAAEDDLRTADQHPAQWLLPTGDYANTRHTALKQINASNAHTLRPVWTFSTGVLRGHEGGPLIIGNVMYVHTPFPNIVFALDVNETGRIRRKYEPKQNPNVIPAQCCHT